MADVTINSLSPLTPSTGLYLPVTNGSSTGKVTLSQVCGVMTSAQITTALGYTPVSPSSNLIAKAWGAVDAATITLLSSSGNVTVTRPSNGRYTITLNPGVTDCTKAAIVGQVEEGLANGFFTKIENGSRAVNSFNILISNNTSVSNGYDFSFLVFGN